MKISAKTEYACIAMLELAGCYGSGEPVRIRKIADDHGIPSRFLVQILLQLKGSGLVTSTRGAAGGYRLIKPPGDVTLGQVMSVIEGHDAEIVTNATVNSPQVGVLLDAWREVSQTQSSMLAGITLADLVERAGEPCENMYYI